MVGLGVLLRRLGASVLGRAAAKKAATGVATAGARAAAARVGGYALEGAAQHTATAQELTQMLAQRQATQQAAAATPMAARAAKGPVKSFVDRMREWGAQRAQRAAEMQRMQTPVSEQVKGMTWQQRAARLKEQGALLSKHAVAAQMMTPEADLSIRDVIRASEAQQEQARAKRVEELEKKGTFGGIVKSGATGAIAMLALPVVLKKLGDAVEGLTSRLLERQRDLERYSPVIAGHMAKIDWQKLRLDIRTARRTEGSTAALANSLHSLRQELQPLREAGITLTNVLATYLAQAAQSLMALVKSMPLANAALNKLAEIEKERAEKAKQDMTAGWQQFIDAMHNGHFGPQGDLKPGKLRTHFPRGPVAEGEWPFH